MTKRTADIPVCGNDKLAQTGMSAVLFVLRDDEVRGDKCGYTIN
jgi:hypothetical protein